MVYKLIGFPGKQVESMRELTNDNGSRKNGIVYFVDDKEVDYWKVLVINEQTDANLLSDQIAKGMVFLPVNYIAGK